MESERISLEIPGEKWRKASDFFLWGHGRLGACWQLICQATGGLGSLGADLHLILAAALARLERVLLPLAEGPCLPWLLAW